MCNSAAAQCGIIWASFHKYKMKGCDVICDTEKKGFLTKLHTIFKEIISIISKAFFIFKLIKELIENLKKKG